MLHAAYAILTFATLASYAAMVALFWRPPRRFSTRALERLTVIPLTLTVLRAASNPSAHSPALVAAVTTIVCVLIYLWMRRLIREVMTDAP